MSTTAETAEILVTANAARAELATRIAAAESVLREATEHRENLAQQAFRGSTIAARVVRDAGLAVGSAEESLSHLKLQVPFADAAVAAAAAAHAQAAQVEKDAAFAVAVRALITASREMTEIGNALTQKGAEFHAAYARVIVAKSACGTAPNESDQAGYLASKSQIRNVVPAAIQDAIVASGVNYFDVGQRVFAHWGKFAAPDEIADEPAAKAEEQRRAAIEFQQAFDEAGREQALRSLREVQSWQPTVLQSPGDPRHRIYEI